MHNEGGARRIGRRRRPAAAAARMTRPPSARPAATASSPFGTTIGLVLLLVVSDLTGKLPPSVLAERMRYYSGHSGGRQNRRNSNYRQRSERGRQRKAESGPASGRHDQRGAVRRQLQGLGGELLIPGGDIIVQPGDFDPSSAADEGLLLTTSNGMGGGGLNLLEELFGEDFELTERDPSECEVCENCLQCIDCGKYIIRLLFCMSRQRIST